MKPQTNEMPEKLFKEFKHAIFKYMQHNDPVDGENTFQVDVGDDMIDITFNASIEYFDEGDNMTTEHIGTTTVRVLWVEINTFDLPISIAQLMELENEVKLNN